jgi:apolipoprotein N-acyltransferase
VSAVVDPVGRIIARSSTFTQEGITATIHWMRGHTLYEWIGDWPWLVVSALALMAAFRARRRPALVTSP